ncbi:MAG: hypothetical protein HKN41_08925 [Ilumatobacter sp.]|nr:hypothetical protein [Ilumatobacter sp.]
MRRITWFVTGVAAGAAGTQYAARKVKQTAAQLTPGNVAKRAAAGAKSTGRQIVDAVKEGRSAMHAREDELKARRDARVETLDDQLEPGDRLLVDGQPVDAGRVIVLKQQTEQRKR